MLALAKFLMLVVMHMRDLIVGHCCTRHYHRCSTTCHYHRCSTTCHYHRCCTTCQQLTHKLPC
jgi:hypothetical protein